MTTGTSLLVEVHPDSKRSAARISLWSAPSVEKVSPMQIQPVGHAFSLHAEAWEPDPSLLRPFKQVPTKSEIECSVELE